MKVNELRIGNQLFIPGLDRYVIVCGIYKGYFRCEDSDGVLFDESVRIYYLPIPLTPSILEAAGFEKRRDGEYLYSIDLDKHISIVVNNNNIFPMLLQDAEFSGGELNVYSCNLINYLHQLQNLYFALTGTELEIDVEKLK